MGREFLEFVDVKSIKVDLAAVSLVPAVVAFKYNILPISLERKEAPGELTLALADIYTSLAAVDNIRLATRCRINLVQGNADDIWDALARIYPEH